MDTCSSPECTASGTKRGLCERHYRQARRRGLVGWDGTPCSEDGCDQPALSRGLCDAHYRLIRKGTRGTCVIEGCESPIFGREWCQVHYSRFTRHGDPLAWKKPNRQTCTVEGCDRGRVGDGLCDLHYRRKKRYGSTDLPAKPTKVAPSPFACKQCGAELPKLTRGRRAYCSPVCREAWECWDRRDKHRGRWLKRYSMTEDDFRELLESQDGRCAICATDDPSSGRNWCVDHCHKTGKVRGILCSECNNGLGKFKDDPALLRRAVEYLTT